MKSYRFFYHYYKAKQKMTVHFRGKCHTVKHVRCLVPCETKWNPTQPNIVMQGFAHDVTIDTVTDTAIIEGER
jgi:hypothetical protein